MVVDVENLIKVFLHALIEAFQCPHGMATWINFRTDSSEMVLSDICTAHQVADELRNCGIEHALACTTPTWLACLSLALGHAQQSKLGFPISALEVRSLVAHNDLRHAVVPTHAITQNHHARAIGRWIETQIKSQHFPRIGVSQERQPDGVNNSSELAVHEFERQRRVIDVCDVPRPHTMPRGCPFEIQELGLQVVRCFFAYTGDSLRMTMPAFDQ